MMGMPDAIDCASFAVLNAMERVPELPALTFTVCAANLRKLFIGQRCDFIDLDTEASRQQIGDRGYGELAEGLLASVQ
jgi:hypothetical protein